MTYTSKALVWGGVCAVVGVAVCLASALIEATHCLPAWTYTSSGDLRPTILLLKVLALTIPGVGTMACLVVAIHEEGKP